MDGNHQTGTDETVDDDVDKKPVVDPVKEALMPPIPGVPPVAAPKDGEEEPKQVWWKARMGYDPPEKVYGPSDTSLWPEEAAELFRATKINKDAKEASRYMRWWFKTHEGMPRRVPKIPKSAYSMYYTEQKRSMFLKNGKFNTKKDGKKIGASWKKLSDKDKQPYMDRYAVLQDQRDANQIWWNEKISAWREDRRQKRSSSEGFAQVCDCSKCVPSSDDDD